MVDYDKKMADINTDYYSSIARYKIIESIYKEKKYIIDSGDDDETVAIKTGLYNELLVDIGRSIELFFKYIIKIKRAELFPMEPYDSTSSVKGYKDKETLSAAVIREIANRVHASNADVDYVLNTVSVGPKAHDFNYVYRVIEKMFPDINSSFKYFLDLLYSSRIADEHLIVDETSSTKACVTFPTHISEIESLDPDGEKLLSDVGQIINDRINSIDYSGDIFTRLRYFANNPNDKTYNIDELFALVSDIKAYCSAVHFNDNKIDLDPELLLATHIKEEKPDNIRFTKEELKKLLKNKLIQENTDMLLDSIYFCDMTTDEILDSLSFDPKYYEDETSICIFTDNLTKEDISYFFSHDIYDFEEMAWILKKPNPDFIPAIMPPISKKHYSINEIEKFRIELCNGSNDFSNLDITKLKYLSIEGVKEFLKYPELLNVYKRIYRLDRSYAYDDDMVKLLLNNEEVRKNPISLYGLDMDQLSIYYEIKDLLARDIRNNEIINHSNSYLSMIDEHITENIKMFSYDQRLLCVLPLMLDPDDNKEILSILIEEGLDTSNLDKLDTTIFCMPPALVRTLVKSLEKFSQKLIVDNNINSKIYEIINMLKEKYKVKTLIQELKEKLMENADKDPETYIKIKLLEEKYRNGVDRLKEYRTYKRRKIYPLELITNKDRYEQIMNAKKSSIFSEERRDARMYR